MSRGRSLSLASPEDGKGIKDIGMRNKGIKMADKAQWLRNKFAKAGEADRVIQTKMPKVRGGTCFCVVGLAAL